MRNKSLKSIHENYGALLKYFTEFSSVDYNATAKCRGFVHRMKTVDFVFFLNLSQAILGPIEKLNAALQNPKLSACESIKKATTVMELIECTKFDLFERAWNQAIQDQKTFDLEIEKRGRKKRKTDNEEGEIKDHFKSIFMNCCTNVLSAFESRFKSDSKLIFVAIENFALNKETDEERQKLTSLYSNDFNFPSLIEERNAFFTLKSNNGNDGETIEGIISLLPIYVKFVTLLLTIPGSSCTSERSFSMLRRQKTYLRSTMKEQRLNSMAIMAAHKDRTDKICIDEVLNEFIMKNDLRRNKFYVTPTE